MVAPVAPKPVRQTPVRLKPDRHPIPPILRGWRPVPRSRHPELFPAVPNIGFGNDDNDIIQEGGQVLCEKPTKDVNAAKVENERKSIEQMNGISWTQGAGQNPFAQTMPRVDLGSTQTEFGHSAEFKE